MLLHHADDDEHDFEWPSNYRLRLSKSEQGIFLRPHFNPMEWEPMEVYNPFEEATS